MLRETRASFPSKVGAVRAHPLDLNSQKAGVEPSVRNLSYFHVCNQTQARNSTWGTRLRVRVGRCHGLYYVLSARALVGFILLCLSLFLFLSLFFFLSLSFCPFFLLWSMVYGLWCILYSLLYTLYSIHNSPKRVIA